MTVEIITLLHRHYYGGLILELHGEGPKFYRGVALREDVDRPGEVLRGAEEKYAKADYLAVPGEQRDLILRVTNARRDYDHEVERYRRDLELAVNDARQEARERFQAERPYPTCPDVETLIKMAERGDGTA